VAFLSIVLFDLTGTLTTTNGSRGGSSSSELTQTPSSLAENDNAFDRLNTAVLWDN